MAEQEKKLNKQKVLKATIAALGLVNGALLSSPVAKADEGLPYKPGEWEECYGIVRAGLNDCASSDGRHLCGGGARIDADPTEYILVPAGMCARLVGGIQGPTVQVEVPSQNGELCTNSENKRKRARRNLRGARTGMIWRKNK